MKAAHYLPRVVDDELATLLSVFGGVLIVGPKWCGKTWTGGNLSRSSLFLADRTNGSALVQAARTAPAALLEGATPRLIDEWQEAPELWDAVRSAIDDRGEKGQFILTGSAVPADAPVIHTGTGRIVRLIMRPMSLFESQESNGSVSLKALFEGLESVSAMSNLTVERLAYALVRGGWPDALDVADENATLVSRKYLDAVVETDISRVDGIARNPDLVRALLRSLARHCATATKTTNLRQDMAEYETALSRTSLDSYLEALRRIFIIEDVPAWNPHLRSASRLRKAPKRHFVDPSLATAALRINPEQLLTNNFDTFGFLFESLCVRDLRIYAQSLDGQVFHYRDSNDLEADVIVQLADGRWAPLEVKMGSRDFDAAARHLIALKKEVQQGLAGTSAEASGVRQEPSFMAILTGTPVAYRREDGVFVLPIGCLKP
ncbi:MAG: DUF4143 domain-containing protein [Raoultibacter sp.]